MNDREFYRSSLISISFVLFWASGSPFFIEERIVMFITIMAFGGILIFYTRKAKRGENIFLRTIPGLKAVEEAWADPPKWVNPYYTFPVYRTWIRLRQ